MMDRDNWKRITLRLPPDVAKWLRHSKDANSMSINSEIVKALRQVMEANPQTALVSSVDKVVTVRLDDDTIKAIAAAVAGGAR